VSQVSPNTTIHLGILRDGKPENLEVKVGEYHANAEVADNSGAESHSGGKLGLAVDDLSPEVRQQLHLPERVNGAAIESVRPASPAEEAGLAPGDVILEVNRHPVVSAEKFASEVHASPAGKDILLLVWSNGGASYRVLHPTQSADNGM
jgi:serine protease Do